jgi:predicted sugar kinase
LKSFTSSGSNQILLEFIQTGGRTVHFEIYKLTNYILDREEMPEQWKESVIIPTYKKGDKWT